MTITRISPEEALAKLQEGYAYLDVRTVEEFAEGHPQGAYNIPIAVRSGMAMSPNADFLAVVRSAFPADAKLVIGCKAGGRSLRAAELLHSAGYTNVVDQRAGFSGGTDPSGRPEQGWKPKGLPTATTPEPGRSYTELASNAKK